MSDLSSGDWQDWLQHPCTQAFVAQAQLEWGAGGVRFEGFIDTFADSRQDDPIVLQQIRQIAVARREILRLLKWPQEEVSRLRSSEHDPASPRRAMEPALAGQSRRGGL